MDTTRGWLCTSSLLHTEFEPVAPGCACWCGATEHKAELTSTNDLEASAEPEPELRAA